MASGQEAKERKGGFFSRLIGRGEPTAVPSPAETVIRTPIESFRDEAKDKKLRNGRFVREVKDGKLTLTVLATSSTSSDRASVQILNVPTAEGTAFSQSVFLTEALVAKFLGGDPWIPMKDPNDPDRPFSGPDRDHLATSMIASGVKPFAVPGVPETQIPQSPEAPAA